MVTKILSNENFCPTKILSDIVLSDKVTKVVKLMKLIFRFDFPQTIYWVKYFFIYKILIKLIKIG